MKTSAAQQAARHSSVAFACLCLIHSSFAQNAASGEAQLKEVVVTANRTEQALQTAPVGASVILGSDIIASGVLDANEAVRRLGGVVARSDLLGGREAAIDLRGFGDSAANNMVVVIDGVRISENELASARLSAISAERIERIEIVRGGASVAWGEGATAGVIQVVTKGSAPSGLSGAVQLGIASHDTRDARASLQVAGEGIRFFTNIRSFHTDGWRDNSGQRNDAFGMGLEVGAQQGLKMRVELSKESLGARLPGAIAIADFASQPTKTKTPLDNASRAEDRVSALLQYRMQAWTFSLDMAQRGRSASLFQDFAGFGFAGDSLTQTTSEGSQISPRVQYRADWGGAAVNALVGVDNQNWDYTNSASFSGFQSSDETASQSNRARFARVDVLLPSLTRLVVGARRESIRKDFADSIAATAYEQSRRLSAWEFGVNQTIAERWDVYARASRSYRVANVDENRFLLTPLEPQTARDAEIGLRWREGASNATVRVFNQRTRQEIAYDNNTGSNVNLDPIRRRGLEIEAQTLLAKQWRIGAQLQRLNVRFSEGPSVGKTPPHVARTSGQVRVGYQPSSAHLIETALNYRGGAVLGNDLSNSCSQRVPSRTTLDVLYRFTPTGERGWSLSAGVENLAGRKTFAWGFTNATCSAVNVYPELERVFKLNARYAF
jgi:iron complex outermembrane recepter protein